MSMPSITSPKTGCLDWPPENLVRLRVGGGWVCVRVKVRSRLALLATLRKNCASRPSSLGRCWPRRGCLWVERAARWRADNCHHGHLGVARGKAARRLRRLLGGLGCARGEQARPGPSGKPGERQRR
eukprot:scaffold47730_cov64-Phaeocystis_antarctica.AAC.3